MKRWFTFLPMLLPALASAQTSPDALTFDEARSLSPDALARRVLGASGALVKEASVEGARGQFANPRWLAHITFTSAPRAAGFPGVCAVDTYGVDFSPASPSASLMADAGPAKVAALRTGTVYRIVDAGPVPTSGWSDDYGRKLADACARKASVISSGPYGGLTYFSASFGVGSDQSGNVASFVRKVLIDLSSRTDFSVCQTRHRNACQGRAQVFVALSFTSANVGRCEKLAVSWCVSVSSRWGLNATVLNVEVADPGDLSKPPTIRSANVEDIQGVE